LRTVRARSSFEPLHGEILAGGSSNESHPTDAGGRHYASDPTRTSKRYGSAAVSASILKQAQLGDRHESLVTVQLLSHDPPPNAQGFRGTQSSPPNTWYTSEEGH
jgi:hypothetical protein